MLVALIHLVDRLPPLPAPRGRGRPPVYSDRLFWKALILMIVRRLSQVHTLLTVLDWRLERRRYPSTAQLLNDPTLPLPF